MRWICALEKSSLSPWLLPCGDDSTLFLGQSLLNSLSRGILSKITKIWIYYLEMTRDSLLPLRWIISVTLTISLFNSSVRNLLSSAIRNIVRISHLVHKISHQYSHFHIFWNRSFLFHHIFKMESQKPRAASVPKFVLGMPRRPHICIWFFLIYGAKWGSECDLIVSPYLPDSAL